jgi:hypothetical protein
MRHDKLKNLNLPQWILDDIENAVIVGNTIELPDGRKYNLNNKLNHLSGKEWTYFINSVVNTNYKTSGADSYAYNIRKIHPSPKPPQLMSDIIKFFTKEDEIVFDYFMGVGGSLLGAALTKRRAFGIDLNEKYIEAYKNAAMSLNLTIFPTINTDSIEYLKNPQNLKTLLNNEKISLVLLDPPYFNMMGREKTGGDVKIYGNNSTPFTNSKLDLGNMTKEKFLNNLKISIEYILPFVKEKGYFVIFIKDLQPKKKELNLLHYDIINSLNNINNIYYKGLKIWADQTTKLFPYGYPFSFVANQIHQYILVFRKEY